MSLLSRFQAGRQLITDQKWQPLLNVLADLCTAVDTLVAKLGSASAITDDALVVGNVVYKKSTGHVGLETGASEAIAEGIVGIADGTYAGAATASYLVSGQAVPGLSGLTAGVEYWAKDDGTLAPYTGLTSGKWSRPMGVAETATILRVRIGDTTLVQ